MGQLFGSLNEKKVTEITKHEFSDDEHVFLFQHHDKDTQKDHALLLSIIDITNEMRELITVINECKSDINIMFHHNSNSPNIIGNTELIGTIQSFPNSVDGVDQKEMIFDAYMKLKSLIMNHPNSHIVPNLRVFVRRNVNNKDEMVTIVPFIQNEQLDDKLVVIEEIVKINIMIIDKNCAPPELN